MTTLQREEDVDEDEEARSLFLGGEEIWRGDEEGFVTEGGCSDWGEEAQEGCEEEGEPGTFRGDIGMEEKEEEEQSRMCLERVEGEKWGGRNVELCEISEQGDDEMEDWGLLPKTSLPHGDSVSSPSDEIRPSETSQDLEKGTQTRLSNIQDIFP